MLSPSPTRRDVIRLGGLLAAGSSFAGARLPQVNAAVSPGRGKARSCILVYLLGGPPHLDMWDLKPDAPAEIRGPFKPIAARVPGIHVGEHLPRLAGMADKFAIVRSVSHPNNNHTPMIYYTLTGHEVERPAEDNNLSPPSRTDHPHMGAVLSRIKPVRAGLPGYVALPELAIRSNDENVRQTVLLRGGKAGYLGSQHDPLGINGDVRTAESIPALTAPRDIPGERLERRQSLLSLFEQSSAALRPAGDFDLLRRTAVLMTGAANGGRLYALDGEEPRLRERYGRHRFGQSMLLARRLAEAGVPMIAIHFNYMTKCDGWDTHAKNFDACKTELLPLLDQGLSALLEDLEQRGLLDETLVVCMGEFGRTPRINGNAGRDHWGHCSSVVLAGGGIHGGAVLGASDKHGAYPAADKFDPVDIQATIYHCLGFDPAGHLHDQLKRTWALSTGQVITRLLG